MRFSVSRIPVVALLTLLISHLLVAFAGLVAPYDPSLQNRDFPYAPPSHLYWIDLHGNFHLLPRIYNWVPSTEGSPEYVEDRGAAFPVRLFVAGDPYKLLGLFRVTTHLFGTDAGGHIFLFGTDALGRDLLSRVLYGGRLSLFTGVTGATVSLTLALLLGSIAGFFGHWIDETIMRAAELFLALPWLYLLFALRAFLPLSISSVTVFLLIISVLGVAGWARPARLIRGVVLAVKEQDFVTAARGFGASDWYLLRVHLLPEAIKVAATQAAILVPQFILAEITLSFFGLGVSDPIPSLGGILSSLRQYDVLSNYWWMSLPAVLMIPIVAAYYTVFARLANGSAR